MNQCFTIKDYQHIFINDIPLLDVRAPVEFKKGAFPLAENIPLLTDMDRHLVGTCYKIKGYNAAIKFGKKLVSVDKRKVCIQQAWSQLIKLYPNGAIYCFRGGLRSKITQQWIKEHEGVRYPYIKGGYKALRKYLLNELDLSTKKINFIVIGGRTGVGKTQLIGKIKNSVNLEALAHHRGSAFGQYITPQPTQINFENSLAIAFLKHRKLTVKKPLIIENESRNIGSIYLPNALYKCLNSCPFLILLDEPFEQRLENIYQEYVINALSIFRNIFGKNEGFNRWCQYVFSSLQRIQKRLGMEHYFKIRLQIKRTMEHHVMTGSTKEHKNWIGKLLLNYYDPMYDYQIKKKYENVIFRGNTQEVQYYLNNQ